MIYGLFFVELETKKNLVRWKTLMVVARDSDNRSELATKVVMILTIREVNNAFVISGSKGEGDQSFSKEEMMELFLHEVWSAVTSKRRGSEFEHSFRGSY